jgi:flagellar hook-basal body complex protein FliE
MDIRASQAERLYQTTRPATEANRLGKAGDSPDGGGGPGAYAAAAAADFAQTLKHAEQTAQDAMIGKADPHALVQALSQSELAVETAVAVRDKVVEAYQEILRMPV